MSSIISKLPEIECMSSVTLTDKKLLYDTVSVNLLDITTITILFVIMTCQFFAGFDEMLSNF